MDRELELALTEIRARISQADPLLIRLIKFAIRDTTVFQYGIAVRLGAVTIYGVPSPSRSTGEVLDGQTLRFVQMLHAVDVSAGRGEGDWPAIEKALRRSSIFTSQAKSDDEAYSKITDKLESSEFKDVSNFADLPDDLASEAVYAFAPPKAFTLTDAIIRKDNGTTEDIGNIRINLSSVEAWWVFDLRPAEGIEDALAEIQRSEED
jgi:hypothetical protein